MNIIQLISTLFLSILLEPWPISSSGHALLALCLYNAPINKSLYNLVEHCSHIVIAFVTLVYFAQSWIAYAHFLNNNRLLLSWVMHGCIIELITALVYVILRYNDSNVIDVRLGFLITGILLLSTAWCSPGVADFCPTFYHSTVLGVLQGCALLPGISRFGILFWYARWQGVSPSFAFFLCFLLGFAVSCAGGALGIYTLYSSNMFIKFLNPFVGLTMLISAIGCYVGFFVVHSLIEHPYFYCLGWYELCIAIVSLVFF